mmetsp:Transcript_23327/g.33302  ORF Transcript_23327/g.33302 Transcript_23327/m.33302 type:complete len:235 (+) Transcript_23327:285-989(+)
MSFRQGQSYVRSIIIKTTFTNYSDQNGIRLFPRNISCLSGDDPPLTSRKHRSHDLIASSSSSLKGFDVIMTASKESESFDFNIFTSELAELDARLFPERFKYLIVALFQRQSSNALPPRSPRSFNRRLRVSKDSFVAKLFPSTEPPSLSILLPINSNEHNTDSGEARKASTMTAKPVEVMLLCERSRLRMVPFLHLPLSNIVATSLSVKFESCRVRLTKLLAILNALGRLSREE